jgi:hypothetical protein
MTNGSGGKPREINPREINLGDAFGDVVVRVNGAGVAVHRDGAVEILRGSGDEPPAGELMPEVISLGDEFGDVEVRVRGIRVEIHADGTVCVHGDVPVANAGISADRKPPSAVNDAPGTPRIGETMPDGTKYAGLSPRTKAPMYVTPADAPLTMKWNDAMKYAADFEGHGRPKGTFRVPTAGELNVLFQNRAKIGGFNETGSYPAGLYWSSTEYFYFQAFDQRFCDGYQRWDSRDDRCSVRLVRS